MSDMFVFRERLVHNNRLMIWPFNSCTFGAGCAAAAGAAVTTIVAAVHAAVACSAMIVAAVRVALAGGAMIGCCCSCRSCWRCHNWLLATARC
jgi:hypothetical protein